MALLRFVTLRQNRYRPASMERPPAPVKGSGTALRLSALRVGDDPSIRGDHPGHDGYVVRWCAVFQGVGVTVLDPLQGGLPLPAQLLQVAHRATSRRPCCASIPWTSWASIPAASAVPSSRRASNRPR